MVTRVQREKEVPRPQDGAGSGSEGGSSPSGLRPPRWRRREQGML